MNSQRSHPEQGMAFFVVLLLTVISVLMVGTFFTSSLAKTRHVELRAAEVSAFSAAESALNVAVDELWTVYQSGDPKTRVASLDPFDGKSDEEDRYVLADRAIGSCTGRAWVESVHVVPNQYVDVRFMAEAENPKAKKTLFAVVRYGHAPAAVFDHAYFINNFGWLWGAGITVNGSVRSNGNFSVKSAVVNGDIYASENEELSAAGTIEGDVRWKDIDWYNKYYDGSARPTNPSAPPEDANGNGVMDPGEDRNGNGVLDDFKNKDGYDGTPENKARLPKIDMPYLGDLAIYKEIAIAEAGKLSQGGFVVDAVYGDDLGESGNLLLVGTTENPIVVNGPVVITNDIVLKGVITGNGTIYAGRNVHIIGDLSYANPPIWGKPIENPDEVAKANATKDLVGLAAKGSVILGDYTGSEWSATTRRYQTPPFTQAYEVDPSDGVNGYVSYHDSEGRPMFDGDYRAYDGGMKATVEGGLEKRKFYESSFADEVIAGRSDAQVKHVDAVIYTNHLLSGKIGEATFNGTLVSRDEAIIYSGSMFINYDIRTRQGGYEFLDVYLPRVPAVTVVYWGEAR